MSERKAKLHEDEQNRLTITSVHGGRFELVYDTEEIGGDDSYGAYLFVKSGKSFQTFTRDNSPNFYKEMEDIKNKIQFAHAENDPEKAVKRFAHAAEMKALFDGITPLIYAELLPNGYCNRACCWTTPWLLVTTPIGHIEIGWRKRVINIDWTRTLVQGSGKAIFPGEETTRSEDYDKERYVHAWGMEKAKEYLKKLHDPETLNIKKERR